MAPISNRMQQRYDAAVQTALDVLDGNLTLEETRLDDLSDLKGMFNRCVRQDQWDWFSVYTELGEPPRDIMRRIAGNLKLLRRGIADGNQTEVERVKRSLLNSNVLHYLHTYQQDLPDHVGDSEAGWVYILSTREQPDILKIGMTRRTVAERVKEINSASGLLIPYAARRVFRVTHALLAEKQIHQQLAACRIRPDREFFKLSFAEAVRLIEAYIESMRLAARRRGKVLWFDVDKQYGFISVPNSDENLFVHAAQVSPDAVCKLYAGVLVEFDLGRRKQGQCALNVSLVSQEAS